MTMYMFVFQVEEKTHFEESLLFWYNCSFFITQNELSKKLMLNNIK